MEIRYVTLSAISRCVPRAGERASGGGALYETRLEHRAVVPTPSSGGGKVLDLAEYRRRLASEDAGEPPVEGDGSEGLSSPARPSRWERAAQALDALATVALIAVAGGLLLAVWSMM